MIELWPMRFCTICGDPIPQVGKTGHNLSKYAYQQRQSCGGMTCYGKLQSGNAKKESQYELQPIDYFIMGRPIK